MNKIELLNKHGKELLQDVSFWEDTEQNKPFYYKVDRIVESTSIEKEKVEEALKDYQHFMEV